MILIYVLLILLLVFLVWDGIKGFHIVFTAHASATEMIARVGLQHPILSVEIHPSAPSPMLIIRLFGIRLIRRGLAAQRKPGGMKKGLRLARAAAISGLAVSADYGLGDPYHTAMMVPAAGAMARFLPFEQLDVGPDYLATESYLSVRGNATVKFGKTILNYVKNG